MEETHEEANRILLKAENNLISTRQKLKELRSKYQTLLQQEEILEEQIWLAKSVLGRQV